MAAVEIRNRPGSCRIPRERGCHLAGFEVLRFRSTIDRISDGFLGDDRVRAKVLAQAAHDNGRAQASADDVALTTNNEHDGRTNTSYRRRRHPRLAGT